MVKSEALVNNTYTAMKMASGSIDLISKFVLHVQEGGIVVCAFQRFCFLCSCWLLFFHCLSHDFVVLFSL